MSRAFPGIAVSLLLAALLYFPGLGAVPFYDKGEPREVLSLVAQTDTGNWILPLTDGTTIPSKPPLFRWSGGIAVGGTGRLDERSARLPSAVLATLAVVAVAATAGVHFGAVGGVAAGVALATTWTWVAMARVARVDMALAACLTIALLALERVCRASVPSRMAAVALYVAGALAVLAKGPVGVAIPGVVALAYLVGKRDLGRLRHVRLVMGAAIVLVVAGSWYALAAWQGGEAFVSRQLGHENVARFLGGAERTSHAKPVYYYGPAFLAGALPWTLLFVPLGAFLWTVRRRLDEAGAAFPLAWIAGIVAFYSAAAGKRSVYLLPVYPAVALLVGAWCAAGEDGRAALRRTRGVERVLVFALLGAGAIVALAVASRVDVAGATPWLHPKDRQGLALALVAARAHGGAMLGVLGVLALTLLVVLAGLRRTSPLLVTGGIGALAVIVALLANGVVIPTIARARTLRPFAAEVAARVPPDAELRFVGPVNGGMRFYLGRPARIARRPIHVADDPARCRYLLVWKERWRILRPEVRAALAVIGKSAGSGPEGDDRLLLARVRSPACGDAAAPGPVARLRRPCEQGRHGRRPDHLG